MAYNTLVASAQAPGNVAVPREQRELTNILSKYNDLYESAPNDIQRRKIEPMLKREFCGAIPKGDVSGWIGEVNSIDDRSPAKSIGIILAIHTDGLQNGGLGVELSLGNEYAYGISEDNTAPHTDTRISQKSPLYDVAANLQNGDTIVFSGTFIPYRTYEDCYNNDTTYFALVRFSSIRKTGWGLILH
jgi:hypothetical protein